MSKFPEMMSQMAELVTVAKRLEEEKNDSE